MKVSLDRKKLLALAILRRANKPISHAELVVACAINPGRNLFGAVLDLAKTGHVNMIQPYENPQKENRTYYEPSEMGNDCLDEILSLDPELRSLYSNIAF